MNMYNKKHSIVQINPFFKKRRKSTKRKKNVFKTLWQSFCDVTTYLGLRYFGGSKPARDCTCRTLWLIIWISQAIFCVWLSHDLFARYLTYHVQTSFTYNKADELEFPAITFFNLNTFRKSIVGGNQHIMYQIASYFSKTMSERTILLSQNNETCYLEHSNDDILFKMYAASKKSFMDTMLLIVRQASTDVLKCWWNNERADCSKLFINHATDNIYSTFNQDISTESNGHSIVNSYGAKYNQTGGRWVKLAGPNSGLRLIMNVGRDDFCGAYQKYFGAGFYVQVHDPKAQPSVLMKPSISLQAGFHYEISMSPVVYERRTEHLGKCLNNLPLALYPNAKYYIQVACFIECIADAIWAKCRCFPFNLEGQQKMLAAAYNLPLNNITFCLGGDTMCMRVCLDAHLNSDIVERCPRCKVPCIEKLYETDLSTSRFPSKHMTRLLANELGIGNKSVAKDYLSVNFYFANKNLLLLEDTEAFPLKDLAVTFGWAMALFLGGSFMSPFEFIFYFVRTVELLTRILFRRLFTHKSNISVAHYSKRY